jgi:hypothetical protein
MPEADAFAVDQLAVGAYATRRDFLGAVLAVPE